MEIKKINIGIIGHFGGDKKFLDGQTIKTKEINNYLEKKLSIKTLKFDTYKNARNPFKLLFGIRKIFKKSDVVILIVSTRGYKILLPIVTFYRKLYNKKLLDFVIGGDRYKIYENRILRNLAKKTDRIYVETLNIKRGYDKYDFSNTEILPNFKNLEIQKIKDFEKKPTLKLCTFSRICKEKGIEDAIEAVNKCNEIAGKEIFTLDLYGQVDVNYIDVFNNKEKDFSKSVKYAGLVDADKSTHVLKDYDMLLFPTFWSGEGFPGTLMDALFSGLPVLATDWRYNFDILEEGKTGIKVKVNDVETMIEKLMYYYDNQQALYDMKRKCVASAKQYLPDSVMENVISYILENKWRKE